MQQYTGQPKPSSNDNSHNNIQMVAPNTNGLSESIKIICGKVGIQVHFRGGSNIKSLLMASRTRTTSSRKAEL